jgi:hypothetical protein
MRCTSLHQQTNEIISMRKLRNRYNSTYGQFWSAGDFCWVKGGLLESNSSGDATIGGGFMA